MKTILFALALCAAAPNAYAQNAAALNAAARNEIDRRTEDAAFDFPALAGADNASEATVDNAAWNVFLGRYLLRSPDGVVLVDYGAVSPADRAALNGYVAMLEATDPTALSSDEQLAYWLNFYNALTVKVILDNYPLASIRDIKDGPFDFKGPWNNKRVTVNGAALSLDDIEHEIIRRLYAEPRIHYGVNCASIGCPNLQPTAFAGATLDEALTQAARAFVNHPRGVSVDDGRVTVSSIFVWFREDFGDADAAVLNHIRQYADPDLVAALEGRARIDGHDYDWTLNDAAAAR